MLETLPVVPDPAPPALPPGMVLPRIHEVMGRTALLHRSLPIPMDKSAAFQAVWVKHKLEFTRRGYSLKCDNGKWYLNQWLHPDAGALRLTRISVEKLGKMLNPQREMRLPEPPPVALELEPLPGGLEEKLYDYQRPAARQILRALTHGLREWGYAGAWDCSDLGTGKTFSSLAAALATGLKVGVICPKAVIGAAPAFGGRGSGWHGAFHHFGEKPAFIRNYEALRTGNRTDIIGRTADPKCTFRWAFDPNDTVLIFDECHMARRKSLNRNLLFAALRQGFPVICVSGTMAQSPLHMGGTGVAVGLHRGDPHSYEMFLHSSGCQKENGAWAFPKGRAGAPHLAKIHRTVFPRRGARIRIDDLGDRFPETQILSEAVETNETAAIKEAFAKAQATIENLTAQGGNAGRMKMLEQTAYMEAFHQSERLKIPVIVDMVKAELDEGRSVAVFVNFTDVREALMRELKTQCAIFGGQTQDNRDKCIADFQADRSRVIIANIAAGGVGISLHDLNGNHPRTSIILPSNNAVAMNQAFGRVHRAGGKSRSRQVVVWAAGTIEEQICDSTRQKMAAMTSLNDGDMNPAAVF